MSEKTPISFIVVILDLVILSFLVISTALIIYVDAVIIGFGHSEHSLTEFSQEGLIFLSAIIFFVLSRTETASRGFLCLCAGFFTVLLIRELDAYFDQIKSGFWVYPAILVTAITLGYIRKFPGTVLRPMAFYLQENPFAFITIGLMIVLLFSRIFGSGIIWEVVMDENYSSQYKAIIQEGVELLGYVFIFYGSVLSWVRRTVASELTFSA